MSVGLPIVVHYGGLNPKSEFYPVHIEPMMWLDCVTSSCWLSINGSSALRKVAEADSSVDPLPNNLRYNSTNSDFT